MSPGAIWVREIARGVKAMGPLEMDHSVWTPVASQVVNALPCLQKGEAVWCPPPGTIYLVLPTFPTTCPAWRWLLRGRAAIAMVCTDLLFVGMREDL